MELRPGGEPGQDHHWDEPGILLLTADLAGHDTGEYVEVRGSFQECSPDGSIRAYFLVVLTVAWSALLSGAV
jgi:hypothetical protein